MTSATTRTGFAKCRCQLCNGSIEFAAAVAGQVIACPHCNAETTLYVPPIPVAHRETDKPTRPDTIAPKIIKSRVSIFGCLALFLVGFGLIIMGGIAETMAESAFHQTTAAVQYCTGVLVIASACLLDALRAIARNQ